MNLEVLEPRCPASTFLGTTWPQPGGKGSAVTITYSYGNLLDGGLGGSVTVPQVRAAVVESLALWAVYSPLRFVEVPGVGDVVFSHALIPFSGQAYAPGPGLGGDVFLRQGLGWALGREAHPDLLRTVTHELGHGLGLGHQEGVDAIMNGTQYPGTYGGLGTGFLYPDDVQGIQAIYGIGIGQVDSLLPPEEVRRTSFVVDGVLSTYGSTDALLSGDTPFPGYQGHVSVSYLGDALWAVADNGHGKAYGPGGDLLDSRLLLGEAQSTPGRHVGYGDLGADGVPDVATSSEGTVRLVRQSLLEGGTSVITPYQDYRGEILTSFVGDKLVTLAASVPSSHVKVFDRGGGQLASFLAYPGYLGQASLGASMDSVVTLATEHGHVKEHSLAGELTSSFIRRGT